MQRGAFGIALACVLTGCGSAPSSFTPPTPPPPPPTDVVVVAPRAFEEEIAPLVELRRREGHGVEEILLDEEQSAEQIAERIAKVAHADHSKLAYVVLAGDPRGTPPLATFHATLGPWAQEEAGSSYPTDHPYSLWDEAHLAVG